MHQWMNSLVDDEIEKGQVGELVSGAAASHIGVLLPQFEPKALILSPGASIKGSLRTIHVLFKGGRRVACGPRNAFTSLQAFLKASRGTTQRGLPAP